MKVFLRTNPWKILKNARMGLRLILRGRMSPLKEFRPCDPAQVRIVLDQVD